MARPKGTGKYKDGEVLEPEYVQSHPEQLLVLMGEGKLDCQIYAHFKICKDTYYQWINEHPEFRKAHDIGLPQCEAWWIQWGMRGMQGQIKGFNFNSWIAFMNNKFKWAKNALQDGPTGNTTNISINNMNVLNQKPKEDLISFIETMALKHKDIIDLEFIDIKAIDDTSQSK